MNEQELLEAIVQTEQDRIEAKNKISVLQKKIVEIESALIEASIKKDRLLEKLELLRKSQVNNSLTEREIEIQGFRERHPHLLK